LHNIGVRVLPVPRKAPAATHLAPVKQLKRGGDGQQRDADADDGRVVGVDARDPLGNRQERDGRQAHEHHAAG
jgi:hypothetical protein